MFFSASTGGFYTTEIHGDNMPEDVVEITAEEHAALLSGQSSGEIILADESGRPILQDPPPMTEEQMREAEIARDKSYLASTDYIVTKIAEASALGQDTQPLLQQYATELEQRELARVRIRANEVRV